MGIQLFEHNQIAYEAAMAMLSETGKAAVIHPTGTGKSFIGFMLCAEHPTATVCWLSPSEYIFKTQIENLRVATGGYVPENIRFYTYAKLMNLSKDELSALDFDYIILDEFHRCGAEMWGQGVHTLLSTHSETPILGLSATAIRYLDNRRNMADELFDGCVASEMTLGEAIVRGILHPPKYVLSVFSYQKDLEKYERRVRAAKSRAVRDEGEAYLEALRRALDKADGLEKIFEKHMENKRGKYLVFCADYDHLCEMAGLAPQWFSGIDREPHVYKAYSDDPETSRAFADFKADNSDHLKLLFCIDMLNEGIHVEDVSGVILLRPTLSPIIYKQQIGRALAAGKKTSSVIFDIVLNIENLYSIDAVEEEMQIATAYYRSLGLDEAIINEHFKVVDEVRDCMTLFDKLNDTLSASWDLMFDVAERYYKENGDLDVPKRYVTTEGYTLGTWLTTQRLVHEGKVKGILTDEQAEKLERIGMQWESVRDAAWEKYYAAAKAYCEEHGNLMVNITEKNYRGVNLGAWISNLRTYYKGGVQTAYLTPERIKALEEIGMVWSAVDYLWERNYHAAVKFHQKNGHLDVPAGYVDEDGIRLGSWIFTVRNARKNANSRSKLTDEQVKRLDAIGMFWGNIHDLEWEKAYAAACEYKKKQGDLSIPVTFQTVDGIRLGRWIRRQREAYAEGKLSSERKERLDHIGMIWCLPDPWVQKFQLLERYYLENGHTKMPADYVAEGVWLARWLSEQVLRLNGRSRKRLTVEQIQKLSTVGIYPNAVIESLPSAELLSDRAEPMYSAQVSAKYSVADEAAWTFECGM